MGAYPYSDQAALSPSTVFTATVRQLGKRGMNRNEGQSVD
jgi:hypothetical protein